MTTESKQTRKTPLTTVGISQEQAERLDALLKSRYPGMKRKEFFEGAIAYFERTGYDLQSDMMDFSSLERLTDRLEKSATIIDEENQGRAELKQLFLDIQQKQLALPSSSDISAAHEAKAKAETKLELALEEIAKLKEEISSLEEVLTMSEETVGKRTTELKVATEELRRLNSGLFNKPKKDILNQLGIY